MLVFFIIFLLFISYYYYVSYNIIQLNDLEQIFSQTANRAQEDFKQYSELLLEDLATCYVHVLIIITIFALITFLWILFLKYNAKLIIWLSIFSLPILLSVGLYYSATNYQSLRDGGTIGGGATSDDGLMIQEQTQPFDKALQTILTAELMSYVHNETLWLVISIILLVVLLALFIILYSLRERVSLSIALIKQASKAINGVKSTLIFPIIPRTLGIGALVYGILISLLVITASHTTYYIDGGPRKGLPCNPKTFNPNRTNFHVPQRKAFSPSQLVAPPEFLNVEHVRNNITDSDKPTLEHLIIKRNHDATYNTTNIDNNHRLRQISPRANVHFNGPTVSASRNNFAITSASDNKNLTVANSISTSSQSTGPVQCMMVQKLPRQHVWMYHAFNIFATLWLIHFISGLSQATLAGAFASYYWAFRKPRDVPFFAVTASFFRVIRYHLGDVAFGSFLLATLRYIRLVIEFIDNRIRKKSSPEINNQTTRSVTCFFRIFFWLLDKFLKYIDRNAYIMMSMYGEGYLTSAKRAIELLYKNSTRALVLDYVTYFVLLVSRILITGLAGYVAAQENFTANLHYSWLPILLVVVGTYFISKGLFSVYSMAVDTLFMCFLIDSTNNDGSPERPYFMSKELRRIMKRNTMFS